MISSHSYQKVKCYPNAWCIQELLESLLSDLMGRVTYEKEKIKMNTQNVMLLNRKPYLVATSE